MFIAIDIETTGLNPKEPGSKIFCVAVNDGQKIQVYTDVEKVRKVLENKKITKVIHNAGFDCYWLKYLHNINVINIWDTMLVEQVIIGDNLADGEKNPQLQAKMSAGLGHVLKRYGLADLDKGLQKNFALRPRDLPLTRDEIEYAKNDVRYLLQLQALQEFRATSLDLMRVVNLENSVVEVVVNMRSLGIGFDPKIWGNIADNYHREHLKLLKTMSGEITVWHSPLEVKKSPVNWNSPLQVKKYFASRGIPLASVTDSEKVYQLTKDPVLGSFIELKKYAKLISTYGHSWIKDGVIEKDNRIRPEFKQVLNTGRFACKNPNLQQIPRETEHRRAFIPARGNVFISADFSGQELGIMAAGSGEELWIKAMLRGEDVHSLTASMLFSEWQTTAEKNCSFPKKCKCTEHQKFRNTAKTINFAIAYGAGTANISDQLNLTEREAARLLQRYSRVVPKLMRWLNKNGASAIATRISYSADVFKRRRTLRDPEDWMLKNIGKNNPVQACGANMLKLAMIHCHKEKLPIVLVVHDEIVLEVKKSHAKSALKKIRQIMEAAADYCTGIPGLIKAEPVIKLSLHKQE